MTMMMKTVVMCCWIGVPKHSDLHLCLMASHWFSTFVGHFNLSTVLVYWYGLRRYLQCWQIQVVAACFADVDAGFSKVAVVCLLMRYVCGSYCHGLETYITGHLSVAIVDCSIL